MATSNSHRLGELIGDFFEDTIIQYLKPIVARKGYYLDYRHPREARKGSKEVRGVDKYGNTHKLDIVVEKGGSESELGTPKAFIEMAWRRYTKHSKAKVQEISGAIIPLVQTYKHETPFYSAVLSGDFTENAIQQLESQGFYVAYFTYAEMRSLYSTANISIEWEEDTTERELGKVADKIQRLNSNTQKYNKLQKVFFLQQEQKLKKLADALCDSLDKAISEIIILPIHGVPTSLSNISEALVFIANYNEQSNVPIIRYEITLKYNNGDEFTMKCKDKMNAIRFLHQYT